jgi:cathepsin D
MIPTILLFLLALCVVPFVVSNPTSSARSDPRHIPITRRSNKARGFYGLAKAADDLRAKYKFATVRSKRKRGNTADVPIINQVCRHRAKIKCDASLIVR